SRCAVASLARDTLSSPRSDDAQRWARGWPRCRRKRRHIRSIKSATVHHWAEAVGQTNHRLGSTKDEKSIALHCARHAIKDGGLGPLIEIDQHIATEHDIEQPEMIEVAEQIELPELHHGADSGRDFPVVAALPEIFQEESDREAALYLELIVASGLRLGQGILRQVSRDDVDSPIGKPFTHLGKRHCKRIRLLPSRRRSAPDAQPAPRCSSPDEAGHNGIAKMLKRDLVAKKERLLGRHCF